MLKFFVGSLVLLFSYSCISTPSQMSMTQGEKKAIDSVISIYGGEVSFSKELLLLENSKDNILCNIELHESDLLLKFEKFKYLPPSNIALTFYSLISNKEKNKYFKYKVSVDYKKETKIFEYSKKKLENVHSCIQEAKTILDLLKNENYKELKLQIYLNKDFNYDIDVLLNGIKKISSEYGKIESNSIAGFSFHNTDTGFNFIKIYGILHREKQNNLFSMYIDPKTYKIFKIDYKW